MLQVWNPSVQKDVCECCRSAFLGLGGHHGERSCNFEATDSINCPKVICIPRLLIRICVERWVLILPLGVEVVFAELNVFLRGEGEG